jgi:hypothetical protein
VRLTSLVAFALLALVACAGYRGIREPLLTPYNSRWERRLERTARRDLSCRAVRMIPLSETVLQADGCNRVAEYGLFCLGSRDCDWRAFEGVATRASRDLSCPDTGISVTATSAMERQVYGCGRVASYTLTCAPQHCAWSPVAVSPTAPAPVGVVAVTVSGDVVIPPPPGAEGTPPGAEGTETSGAEAVIPPPPGASTPTGTDDAVIPPPPR